MTPSTILLVEDTPDDVFLTLRALQRNAITNELVVKKDGMEALQWLFGEGGSGALPKGLPSLILLDLKLPGLDGLEVLRRIRSHPATRHTPVVVLTSSSVSGDIHSAYDLGANSFIQKPVDFEQFTRAVRTLATYWLDLNVTAQP